MNPVKNARISIVRGTVELELTADKKHVFTLSASDATRIAIQLLAGAKRLQTHDLSPGHERLGG